MTAPRALARRRHGGAGVSDFLVFLVGSSSYAIRVASVREIVKSARITQVPRAPDTVVGITSFRGRIVTVIDLGRGLGLGPVSGADGSLGATRRARILMVEVGAELVGFAVDEVCEVRRLAEEDVEPAQAALGPDAASYFLGVARPDGGSQGESIVLLDPGGLLP